MLNPPPNTAPSTMGGEKPKAPTPGPTLGGRGLLGIAMMALYCMNRSGGESPKMTERGGVLNPSPATAAGRTGAHRAPTQPRTPREQDVCSTHSYFFCVACGCRKQPHDARHHLVLGT